MTKRERKYHLKIKLKKLCSIPKSSAAMIMEAILYKKEFGIRNYIGEDGTVKTEIL